VGLGSRWVVENGCGRGSIVGMWGLKTHVGV